MSIWTAEQDEFLQANIGTLPYEQIAQFIGKTVNAVRNRRYRLKMPKSVEAWTEEEIKALVTAYSGVTASSEIKLGELAERLGRLKSNVSRKARELGLTDHKRKGVVSRKVTPRKHDTEEERRAAMSRRQKERIATHGHPKGMKGKKHTEKAKERMAKASAERWAGMTEEEKSRHTLNSLKAKSAKHGSNNPGRSRGSWKAGWREIGGQRKYFRSRWEANYARFLQLLIEEGEIQKWQHEPETFWFEKIKRGVRSYLPDFRVWDEDGNSMLHEVKGWMDSRSKTTLKRMAKYHPEQRIHLVDAKAYAKIEKEFGREIADWEW